MDETELRKHRCRFTGHRPEKLGMSEQQVRPLLEEAVYQAIQDGFTTFITGMAKGVDLVAAEIVLDARSRNPQIRLIAALSYPDFGQHWGNGWTERFQDVLMRADLIRCISKKLTHAAYQRRNQWMVDHAALVIAVFNGEAGGTRNTLEYAEGKGTEINFQGWKKLQAGQGGI